jgi:hypothetical protein
MPIFNHTPHTKKQIIEHAVTSHVTNTTPGTNYGTIGPQNDPTLHEPSCCFRRGTIRTRPSIHTRNKELPSHQNHFALWITRSCSLGVNSTRTSLACRYAITSKFKWMSKTLMPFGHHHHYGNSHHPCCLGVRPQNTSTKYTCM